MHNYNYGYSKYHGVLSQKQIVTAVGRLYLVVSDSTLLGIHWSEQPVAIISEAFKSSPKSRLLANTIKQLDQYFQGSRIAFDIPIELRGTVLQQKVWRWLQRIPYGKTQSYKEVAIGIGSPKAARAVGTAIGRNPISIIVPCHRVISSSGALQGYAGGLKAKSLLLEIESSK
jgi:methylated-DNA-[protein]-cysteine S-methyltransferase